MSLTQGAKWLVAVLMLANIGCCRFCDRWCGTRPVGAYPAPAYAPAYAPAPAVAAPAPANCCVPCCVPCQSSPVSGGQQPVPVYNNQSGWKRSYYPPQSDCFCQ